MLPIISKRGCRQPKGVRVAIGRQPKGLRAAIGRQPKGLRVAIGRQPKDLRVATFLHQLTVHCLVSPHPRPPVAYNNCCVSVLSKQCRIDPTTLQLIGEICICR